jgi:hypothetical protein
MRMQAAIVHFDPFNQEPQIYGADVVFEASGEPVNTGLVNAEGPADLALARPEDIRFRR